MDFGRREQSDNIQIKIKEGNGEWKTPEDFIVLYVSQVNKLKDGYEIGVTHGINIRKDASPETVSSFIYGLCDVISVMSLDQADRLSACKNAFVEAMSVIEEMKGGRNN